MQKAEVFVILGHFWNFEKTKSTPEILSFYTCAPQMMIIWCMIPEILSTTDRIFCHFRLYFALLPTNNPENQNFEKMKKNPGGIIILNMSTIHENHMMYRQNFFSFWTFYMPLPPTNPENQNFEKIRKTPWKIIILHKCTIYDNHKIYGSWDVKCTRQNFFVIFSHFLLFYPP